ncbi:hypothetical protein BDM02DRAFT_3193751 [Thelephora ganbajun]|uniref:Uncharacterized protein n=1 Tax=Thelephora ganbajun TaxID=370292 RepID=A0ACB6YXK7_THEGA|nr:hypothetical protein BDM02DRAFT_3193751 [Thelephora ganbajun]
MGCLASSHLFRKPDLVFYCPFCARKKGKPFPFKTTRTILASPEAMVFRCDPALLIVTLTLPDANRQPLVTNLVKAHVSMWYEGNMEAVHMLRVPVIDPSRKKRVRTKEVKAAEEFLRKNELCKIVVIVNTHATQDGTLVNSCEGTWLGSDDISPILMGSLPEGVAKVLDADAEGQHGHHSFVINLSCGEPVINNKTRPTLLAHHCAEVVLSFGVKAVIPALICSPLPELILRWAATTTPLVEIIGRVFPPQYVDAWAPVFSGPDFGHFTLLNHSSFVAGGRHIRCSRESCPPSSLESTSKVIGHGQRKWKVTCTSCDRQARYKSLDDTEIQERDRESIFKVPGTEYYRTPYPVQTKVLEWSKVNRKDDVDMAKGQQTTTVAPTPSNSLDTTPSRKRNRVTSPPPPSGSLEGSTQVLLKKRSRTCKKTPSPD